jgi:hypothetical protein
MTPPLFTPQNYLSKAWNCLLQFFSAFHPLCWQYHPHDDVSPYDTNIFP